MLEDCNPKAVLTYNADVYKEVAEELHKEIPVINLADSEVYIGASQNPERINKPEDLLYCIYTSGTTGNPKMVAHDFTYPLGHIITGSFWHNVKEDSLHLTLADTGWGKAVWGKLYGQWIAGSNVFVYDYEKFEPVDVLYKIQEFGITSFCAPPTVFRFLIREDLTKAMAMPTGTEEEKAAKISTVKEIYEFASTVAYEDIEFILESRTLNLALAQEGLKGTYGLKVGYAIALNENREVFGGDFLSYAMALTAAASDARMAGCTLAAMSNSGSGNQGITVTMPVIAYSIKYGTDDERLARALVLSHLIAIHIKGYLGKLSALCGCVIASTGSSCGLVYLRGGDYEQICAAIKNMIGNITGMVCDGAKVGCAMKVASGVSSALQSAVLAREGICISEHDGIIEKDIEKTIQNLGRIGSIGMQNTDNMILDIMVCK